MHPTREQLAAYASGATSDGMNLLIASHLTFCAECRTVVEQYEFLGAAMMDADLPELESPGDVSMPSLQLTLDKLDIEFGDDVLSAETDSPLPFPLQKEVLSPIEALDWKFRLPGLHECELVGFEGETVSLLRARPGSRILHHTHTGEEATLVLTGEMSDGGVVYRKGDVSLADQNDNHKPEIIGDEICYCLIVMSGPMKFTGPVGRALNILTR